MKRQQGKFGVVHLVLVGIIAVTFPMWCAEKNKRTGSTQAENLSDEARVVCQMVVKQKLVSPGTADFDLSVKVERRGRLGYYWVGAVDSQNKLGTFLKAYFRCHVKYVSGNPMSVESWNVVELTIE